LGLAAFMLTGGERTDHCTSERETHIDRLRVLRCDTSHLARCLARDLPQLTISTDSADRVAYSRDLWPRQHLAVRSGNVAEHRPGVIVWPRSTEEVASVVRWAREARVPLVPFGAGSGVCAGVLPDEKVIVVDMKRMAAWRHLDPAAPTLEVESGYMGVPLEERLGRSGFTLGHFPSSILCSTVGGWVAARSAGQCSSHYGKIEDMVVALECVTGGGETVTLRRRAHGPDLVPLIVGSEGTLAIVTAATLRLHAAPTDRAFGAWSFPSTEAGWEAMRALFQAGLRPTVSRLYDPFDAMLAKRGAGKAPETRRTLEAAPATPPSPGLGAAMLRKALRHPHLLNELIDAAGSRALGGSMLVLIFEGTGVAPSRDMEAARSMLSASGGRPEGEGPARYWFLHRYAVSYRQSPVFIAGAFVDTMEIATTWSNLPRLYDTVRRALGAHVFVMAHLSHAYPDGCCVYFSFAGSAQKGSSSKDWDAACEATYDRAWRDALDAAMQAGGTLAHHHGVGRSKAPRLRDELGAGVEVVRALKEVFDPAGILNPGNLIPAPRSPSAPVKEG
jgi:alkyldihydroxyacetonephosphate synthase